MRLFTTSLSISPFRESKYFFRSCNTYFKSKEVVLTKHFQCNSPYVQRLKLSVYLVTVFEDEGEFPFGVENIVQGNDVRVLQLLHQQVVMNTPHTMLIQFP